MALEVALATDAGALASDTSLWVVGGVGLDWRPAIVLFVVPHLLLAARAFVHRLLGVRRFSPWLHPVAVGSIPVACALTHFLGVRTCAPGSFAENAPLLVATVLSTCVWYWVLALFGLVYELWAQSRWERKIESRTAGHTHRFWAIQYALAFIVSSFVVAQTITFLFVWFGGPDPSSPRLSLVLYSAIMLPSIVLGTLTTYVLFWIAGISLWQVLFPTSNRSMLYFARQYAKNLRSKNWSERVFAAVRLCEVWAYVSGSDRTADASAIRQRIRGQLTDAVRQERDLRAKEEMQRLLASMDT